MSLFPVVFQCYSHFLTLPACSPWSQNPRFAVGIVVLYVILSEIPSGLHGLIAISGCPSKSHLFVDNDTFFEFGVVKNFVYRARITVILTSDLFSCMSLLRLWLCALDVDLLLLPVLSVILKMYKYRCLYSCLVILPSSVSNIQKCHICEIYIFAS